LSYAISAITPNRPRPCEANDDGVYRGRDEIDRIAGGIRATHPDFRYQSIAKPEELGMAVASNGYRAALVRRQLTFFHSLFRPLGEADKGVCRRSRCGQFRNSCESLVLSFSQLDRGSGDVLLEMFDGAGSRDGQHDGRPPQQPG
jgi:hypothetical protein